MGESKPKRSHDNGQQRPRKRGKYVAPQGYASSNQAIPLGAIGIFITCDSTRERKAALQLIPILEQCYDELAGTNAQKDEKDASSAADIRTLIEAEVKESKDKDKFRFKYCDTAVKGCAFIRFPSEEGGPLPQAVAVKLLKQAEASKQLPSPLISRLLPVTHTCHANMEEIEKLAKEFVPEQFPSGEGVEGCSFSVEYEHRSCNNFNRMQVINAFADVVPQPLYKVDLSNPKKTVIVQISRNVCAVSVVEDYKTLAKYNIRKLAEVSEEGAGGKGNKSAAPDSKDASKEVTASDGDKAEDKKEEAEDKKEEGPVLDGDKAEDKKKGPASDGAKAEDSKEVTASDGDKAEDQEKGTALDGAKAEDSKEEGNAVDGDKAADKKEEGPGLDADKAADSKEGATLDGDKVLGIEGAASEQDAAGKAPEAAESEKAEAEPSGKQE